MGGLQEFQRVLHTLNNYALFYLLFHIFSEYSYIIGYDHYQEFNISFWKNASRIFEDEVYASRHRGKSYPDAVFLSLRKSAFDTLSIDNINKLIEYTSMQLKKYIS